MNKINNQNKKLMRSAPEDKIAKMNNSSAAFRELVETLRQKNRNYHQRQAMSEFNPESEVSEPSQKYASQMNWKNVAKTTTVKEQGVEDQSIRLKPRGNVGGRDILHKGPENIPSSKFENTVATLKSQLKNKNIEQSMNPEPKPQFVESAKISTNLSMNKIHETSAPSIIQKVRTFQQNRLNKKVHYTSKKIKDIEEEIILHYLQKGNTLSNMSQVSEIYEFFEGLSAAVNITVEDSFIKKYKNCIYFGQQIHEGEKYQGFLYFYDSKFYYGQFMNSQKNGHGTEIYPEQHVIYKGVFQEGQKTGKFFIRKPNQEYIGLIEKGLYHGEGKLTTKQSVYEGVFQKGQKHGFGEEFFPATGLRFTGYFNKGQFEKRSKSSFSRSSNDFIKGIKFKSNQPTHQWKPASKSSRSRQQKHKSFDVFPRKKKLNLDEISYGSQAPFPMYKPHRRTFYNNGNKTNAYSHKPSCDTMPSKNICQDFDYSFDASSRKDSQISHFAVGNRIKGQRVQGFGHLNSEFPQIDEERVDTNECEQPLPVPCFYHKK